MFCKMTALAVAGSNLFIVKNKNTFYNNGKLKTVDMY